MARGRLGGLNLDFPNLNIRFKLWHEALPQRQGWGEIFCARYQIYGAAFDGSLIQGFGQSRVKGEKAAAVGRESKFR